MTPKSAPRAHAWAPARVAAIVVAAGVAVVLLVVGVALAATSRPGFYDRYHSLKRRHVTWASSSHRDVPCGACHVDPRGPLAAEAALVGDFYGSFVSTATEPAFIRFDAPTREACLACHRYDWSTEASRTMRVPHPAHQRAAAETRDCVSCHKWVAHEETYQAKHKTMPFSGVCASFGCHVGTKTSTQCANCHHVLAEGDGGWKAAHPKVVRVTGANACFEKCHDVDQCRLCHTTGKTPKVSSDIATAGVSVIERLHVRTDWLSIHGTIALQDQTRCLTCHVSEGECQDCHAQRPAFHGSHSTWLAKHKDLAKDARRCLECHEKPWCDACHKQFKEMR